ncbi:hypothetical protein Q3Y86_004442 [Salmonella enterica]|uniref:Uncharacterized protein n=1 Tax=Salmonella enterica subsp. houtenae serovar 45:g,z51:- TaxID=1967611 RepID=A0A753B4U5_SALHO|nr:hypothetical protein [Salmonella enterica subsp. enterica serovar Irumu]EAB4112930.1 hypothetical protein [Salmonella enterica]EBV4237018.1 hypothetical protein [Salmonella enterica subsp. enterica serovar Panama]ECC2871801.1 hypothetical protein [Salmonella enterica subsp. enterica serovar Tanger]EDR1014017.1 hypothetical protein [Salmonella enterica subsp. enterica serovar Glostrup]EDW9015508.1 hypothetical protein [Salmonella enterica subsp. enterica serovar 9,12:-:1,5]EEC0912615.1 hypo
MSWFNDIFGFEESTYAETQANFYIDGPLLHTKEQPFRTFHAGILTLPSLAELRKAVCATEVSRGEGMKLSSLVADAYELHSWPEANGALIQVASQFNLLEMPNEHTTPEKGITNHQHDYTQGPSCAMACAAGTVFRNYLVPVGSQTGQTQTCQLNALADMDRVIGIGGIRMQNGYALLQPDTVLAIGKHIEAMDEYSRDRVRQYLRIGLHSDTEVTIPGVPKDQRVSQALCSALPVAYHYSPRRDWAPFATLVLEASYGATLLAAVFNYHHTGNPRVYLTLVGGGAFGNDLSWIVSALRRALYLVSHHPLDVRLVSNRKVPIEINSLIREFESQ